MKVPLIAYETNSNITLGIAFLSPPEISMFLNPIIIFFLNLISAIAFVLGDIAILGPDNRSIELFLDYKITYTPSIPDEGIIGRLVRATPNDACSEITPPPETYPNQTNNNWFVLADRSSSHHLRCSNRDKIKNAALAGYKAIILYSPQEGVIQNSMSFYTTTKHNNMTIPAVLVTHQDGAELEYRYMYKSGYLLLITSDLPPNLSYYLLPFAIVIGVCLLLTLSFMVFQLIRCVQERRKAQRYRLSKKYLKKLHLKKYEKGIYYETCAICLDDYIEGEKIRILPCNHAYHSKCIDPWLTNNRRVCPVCKAKVRLPGMPESSESESDNDHNQRSGHNEDNERTRLLPSRPSGGHRSSTYGANRALHTPSTSRTGSSFHQPPATSSSRYQGPIDNTIVQPGPSTSAPIISTITAAGSRSQQPPKKKHRKTQRHGQQVIVAADVEPLIAPSQHSINVDDQEPIPEAITATATTTFATTTASSSSMSANVIVDTNERAGGRTLNTARSNRKSRTNVVDHIV